VGVFIKMPAQRLQSCDKESLAAAKGKAAPIIGTVVRSMEWERINALPRRVLDLDAVQDVTPLFRKPGGTLRFWPIQSAMLIECALADGLFAQVRVGGGKTLAGLALPAAMDSKNAIYLTTARLKKQLEREAAAFYGKHFKLPLDRITIISYNDLSSPDKDDILERINDSEHPIDFIACDEAHHLKNPRSARTQRFLRFADEHPIVRFAFLSGTPSTRSIIDYAHLIELALRKNSPVPGHYQQLRDWAGALDVKPEYTLDPGILMRWCDEQPPKEAFEVRRKLARGGYRRRLAETQGVVMSSDKELGSSLIITKIGKDIKLPPAVRALTNEVNRHWSLAGEEFDSATTKARALRQLAVGFYYIWDWPDGEPDVEWLETRAAWRKEVRERLKRSAPGMDSPHLLERAAKRYWKWAEKSCQPMPEKVWASETWLAWSEVKDRPEPPKKAIWVDDFIVDAAIKWAKKQDKPAIIWYRWRAVGQRLAEKSGFPHYGAGTDSEESSDPIIIASIRSQGTGKNLQYHFSRNLFVSFPANGMTVEQTIGRTHRPGQPEDEVLVDWFGHTYEFENAMAAAIEDARFQEENHGQPQKLLYANLVFCHSSEAAVQA
jgi:hypothetical protein